MKKYRFFVAAMGPGEIGQGMAFAKYALGRGNFVDFSVPGQQYLPLAQSQDKNFSVSIASDSKTLNELLWQKNPDLLILCNSKIFTRNDDFPNNPPNPPIPALSIDSNWLFSPSSPYAFNHWVNLYCLNIPEPIFNLGLKQNGGNYEIPLEIRKKIVIAGLIPSYTPLSREEKNNVRREYNIGEDEKLVLLYCSMGHMTKPAVFEKAYHAVKNLIVSGRKIKMIFFTDNTSVQIDLKDRDWFIIRPLVPADVFSKVLASSDLVFQHQGLSTMEQAIGAQIPVIANVKDKEMEKNPDYHRHAWEVGPFDRYGACSMFFFKDAVSDITKEAERLLFDNDAREKMREKQKSLYSKGEEVVYNEAIKIVKD